MLTPLKNALIAAIALFVITACQKEDAEPQPQPEVPPVTQPVAITKAAVVGSYAVTKVEAMASGQRRDITSEWFRSYAGDCTRDDVTEFKQDNSFVVRDGSVACEESTDDTGTWDVISATKLKWDSYTTDIEEFNSTTLRIVSPVYSTTQSTVVFTYTRQ